MSNPSRQPPPPQVVHLTYAGSIDPPGINRIFNAVANATQNGVTTVKLVFQSMGGFVNDGIALYHFFRSCPIHLELYNTGGVQSIAAVAFLGAAKRYASEHATFMFHRTHSGATQAEAPMLRSLADGLVIDNARTEAIIRSHLTLPEDKWAAMTGAQLYLTAAEALQYGLIDAVREFQVPKGALLFSISVP